MAKRYNILEGEDKVLGHRKKGSNGPITTKLKHPYDDNTKKHVKKKLKSSL